MRRLRIAIVPYVLLLTLVLASAAHADNDGRGFYGATGDKAVTNFGFGVIMATKDGMSKWPEKPGSSAFSEGRIGSPRGASSSRDQ